MSRGGEIPPYTPPSGSVPIWLSEGEYEIDPAVEQRYGRGMIEKMNRIYPHTRYNPHRWMFWRRWEWLNDIRHFDGRPAWSDVKSCDEILFAEGGPEIRPDGD